MKASAGTMLDGDSATSGSSRIGENQNCLINFQGVRMLLLLLLIRFKINLSCEVSSSLALNLHCVMDDRKSALIWGKLSGA